jgi:O-antigen ligase
MKNFLGKLLPEPGITDRKVKLSLLFGILVCIYIIILPFSKNISNIFILLSCVVWLIEGGFKEKAQAYFRQPVYFLLGLLYLFYIIGMWNTSNISVGLYNLEKKYTLLIIPLTLGTWRMLDERWINRILYSFVASTTIAALYCLIDVSIKYFNGAESRVFFHEEFSMALEFQPPYFSVFVLFSIYILSAKINLTTGRLFFFVHFTLILFLGLILVLLSSRMALFFGILSAAVIFMVRILNRHSVWQALIGGGFVLGCSLILVYSIPFLKERLEEPFRTDFSVIDGGEETTLSIRWVKWKCSVEGILSNPLLGTGTGDSIDYLVACYEKYNFWGMYPQYRYNSHNQYLELALTLGLIAFTVLFLILFRAFKVAIKSRDWLLILFLLLLTFVCLTESFFERQWGLIFFIFFTTLLMKRNQIISANA